MEKIKVEHHSFGGMIWFGAWLFTLGYLNLGFWKGILAIFVWPYFLGVEMSPLVEAAATMG